MLKSMKPFARLLLVLALIAPAFASAQSTASTTPPTCNLYASATRVNYNTKVKLTWTSVNATSGYLTEVGAISPNGFAYVVPGKNTTYAASFTGPGGSVVCRVGIAVIAGNTSKPIGTGAPIDTTPVDAGSSGGGGGSGSGGSGGGRGTQAPNIPDLTFPTAQSVAPSTQGGSGFVGGIVPAECRGKSTVANCDLCSLAQMAKNLLYFLLGLTIPAAALLFAWAGILYFSARGNPTQIEKAHTVFKTVVIALILAISAVVLINTVMSMLVHGWDTKSWGRDLKCEQTRKARLYNMSLSEYLTTSLPTLSATGGGSGGNTGSSESGGGGGGGSTEDNPNVCPGVSCSNGYVCKEDADEYWCENVNDPTQWETPPPLSGTNSDADLREQFSGSNITVNKPNCTSAGQTNCTSLDGLQPQTVFGVQQIQSDCGCNIIITGGTEGGVHANGTYSHGNGYKLDFGLSTQLNSYLTSWTPIGTRSDGAAQYQNGSTICAKESNHWDCTFK